MDRMQNYLSSAITGIQSIGTNLIDQSKEVANTAYNVTTNTIKKVSDIGKEQFLKLLSNSNRFQLVAYGSVAGKFLAHIAISSIPPSHKIPVLVGAFVVNTYLFDSNIEQPSFAQFLLSKNAIFTSSLVTSSYIYSSKLPLNTALPSAFPILGIAGWGLTNLILDTARPYIG